MSASSNSSSLPDISSTKTNLVEAARHNTPRSPPPFTSDVAGPSNKTSELPPGSNSALLVLRSSSTSPQAAPSLKVTSAPLYIPRPPTSPPADNTTGKPRRISEYVRLSRSELDNKDQTITSLRSNNVQLQAQVRELNNIQESHAALQSVCADLAQSLGCNVEGVAANSVKDVLQTQASSVLQERQNLQQQLQSCHVELESNKGETAVANVRVTNLESQIQESRTALANRDTEIQSLKREVDRLEQSEARNSTAIQSLRQRLTEVEGGNEGAGTGERLSELHTEIGRLKKALNEKDECQWMAQGELKSSQAEAADLRERIASLEDMYEDLCSQLTVALQLKQTDTYDIDTLITEVGRLSQECPQLRLRTDTLTKTLVTCELDSKASRETILRLVSEAKKHEKVAEQLTQLHQAKVELETLLESLEKERDSYHKRLVAAKETMAAQEEELQAKESRISELVSSWHSLKATSEAENELILSEQQKYEELCKALGSLIGSHSKDTVELLQTLEHMMQTHQQLKERLGHRETQVMAEERASTSLQTRLAQVEYDLEREREKVVQLEGELVTHDVMKEGMEKNKEKEHQFYQRLSKALKLDSATARVLTGDFAHDSILVRAEQLAKNETQALAEKQSAFYSAQRQLKTCRQNLASKELYVSLLQKKMTSMEEKLQDMSQREAQLENLAGKSKKLEKQVERLKQKMSEQTQEMERLRTENSEMESIKTRCREQVSEMRRLSSRVEELNESRTVQARQLAEARVRVQNSVGKETRGEAEGKKEITELQEQLSLVRESQEKLTTFQVTVQRLLTGTDIDSAVAGDSNGETPSNYDLIAQLERLMADHKELQDTVKCLGSSLQELEQGFKTGYSNTLTILHTKA